MNTVRRRSIVAVVAVAAGVGVGGVVLRLHPPKQPPIRMQDSAAQPPNTQKPTTLTKANQFNAERARINIATAEELERLLADDFEKPTTPGGH